MKTYFPSIAHAVYNSMCQAFNGIPGYVYYGSMPITGYQTSGPNVPYCFCVQPDGGELRQSGMSYTGRVGIILRVARREHADEDVRLDQVMAEGWKWFTNYVDEYITDACTLEAFDHSLYTLNKVTVSLPSFTGVDQQGSLYEEATLVIDYSHMEVN